MKDFIESLRYDYPIVFRSVVAFIAVMIVLIAFISLPQSPLLRAVGVSSAQKKITSLYYAIFWQVRAATNRTGGESALQVTYGNMAGLDVSGKLIISVPSGNKFIQSKVQIADAKLTDLYGAAALVGQLRTEDAKFEIYRDNQAVIWIRNVPFNVKLIEAGFAIPDPNPPTNIVDKAFSTYYWRIFNGSDND